MTSRSIPRLAPGGTIVQSLRRVTRLPIEVHLMITDPDFFLDEWWFAAAVLARRSAPTRFRERAHA